MTTPGEMAQAFSSHRFQEVYDQLAPDVRWVLVGEGTVEGRDAVVDVCEQQAGELADTSTEFLRFVTVAGDGSAAVDAVARYTAPDGSVSVVSSCDIYEFDEGELTVVTSYAVELDPTGVPNLLGLGG